MTTHFHGSPITGGKGSFVASVAHNGAGAFVSYAHPQQIKVAFESADTVCLDNGAFSKNNTGRETNWRGFYEEFLPQWIENEKLRFFVIPDDISGDERLNDQLIEQLPVDLKHKACPVWHMHEPVERLVRLCNEWEYVCIGSSGEYFSIRSTKWKSRMEEAFLKLYKTGYSAKIHGLRMLDGRVLGNYPLNQADSTNLAINVGKFKAKYIDLTIEACRMQTHPSKWVSTNDPEIAYQTLLKNGGSREEMLGQRCAVLKQCIESVKPPTIEEWIAKMKENK